MENRTFGGFSDLDTAANAFDLRNKKMQAPDTTAAQHAVNTAISTGQWLATGASAGAAFGPPGSVVGGIIGGVLGLGKGIVDIFNTENSERDMSKIAEKHNAQLDFLKAAEMQARQRSNEVSSAYALQQIRKQNLTDYLDIENPYA